MPTAIQPARQARKNPSKACWSVHFSFQAPFDFKLALRSFWRDAFFFTHRIEPFLTTSHPLDTNRYLYIDSV